MLNENSRTFQRKQPQVDSLVVDHFYWNIDDIQLGYFSDICPHVVEPDLNHRKLLTVLTGMMLRIHFDESLALY